MCYDAPKPPDPIQTGAAQTATNIGTAIASQYLNNVDQISPEGTLTYNQTGTYNWTDPVSGDSYDIPTMSVTQQLSPEQQSLYDTRVQTQQGLADLANQQTGTMQQYFNETWNPDTAAIEGRLFDMGQQLLAPQNAQRKEALEQSLANKGIRPGSAAWENEMRAFNDAITRQDLNLMYSGRGQAMAELQAIRNQPINEVSALMSGSQVSQPSWVNPMQNQIGTTDYAGLINNNYNQQLANANAQAGYYGDIAGGLFKLGGSFLA